MDGIVDGGEVNNSGWPAVGSVRGRTSIVHWNNIFSLSFAFYFKCFNGLNIRGP